MFTGLIEDRGRVTGFSGGRLTVETRLGDSCSGGDSVAVDGSCLTVTRSKAGEVAFHCSPETVSTTIVSGYHSGSEVNLETPLSLDGLLHGHLVTGHVDQEASILKVQRTGEGLTAWISYSRKYSRLLVPRGSVAVSGISLTVASLSSDRFSVALIPETLQRTTAGNWKPGTRVNLEYDIVGKYLQRQFEAAAGESGLRKYIEQR